MNIQFVITDKSTDIHTRVEGTSIDSIYNGLAKDYNKAFRMNKAVNELINFMGHTGLDGKGLPLITTIKLVRATTGLSLKDCKAVVELVKSLT